MSHKHSERYELEIPEEGLDYDILDMAFNPGTQAFMAANNISAGMKVLDVGSGSGIMTHYLAQQVGSKGHVWSIDNSPEQLARAQRYCEQQGAHNIRFELLSIYDLNKINVQFDAIYCRFVLHHVHSPRLAIQLFYDKLKTKGIYFAEEGIVSAAFSYPPSPAWQQQRPLQSMPEEEQDGVDRDGEFGMKLFYWMKKTGFHIQDIQLVQPVLSIYQQKKKLLAGHDAYKQTALQQGKNEEVWQAERNELLRLAENEDAIVGFYQSCQVCGIKD